MVFRFLSPIKGGAIEVKPGFQWEGRAVPSVFVISKAGPAANEYTVLLPIFMKWKKM